MVGTIGVASAQDAPSSQTQNETDTTECAVIISIDDSGLAYDQTDVSVAVGDTVCWMW